MVPSQKSSILMMTTKAYGSCLRAPFQARPVWFLLLSSRAPPAHTCVLQMPLLLPPQLRSARSGLARRHFGGLEMCVAFSVACLSAPSLHKKCSWLCVLPLFARCLSPLVRVAHRSARFPRDLAAGAGVLAPQLVLAASTMTLHQGRPLPRTWSDEAAAAAEPIPWAAVAVVARAVVAPAWEASARVHSMRTGNSSLLLSSSIPAFRVGPHSRTWS